MFIGLFVILVLLFFFIIYCFVKHYKIVRSRQLNTDEIRKKKK